MTLIIFIVMSIYEAFFNKIDINSNFSIIHLPNNRKSLSVCGLYLE